MRVSVNWLLLRAAYCVLRNHRAIRSTQYLYSLNTSFRKKKQPRNLKPSLKCTIWVFSG